MNEVRCKSLLAGQTVVAQKVYEAVPIENRWSDRSIHAELIRTGNSAIAMHVVQGCLNALLEAGLVAGDHFNGYTRIHVKERKKEVKHEATATGTLTIARAPTPAADPLETLSAIASRLARTMADIRSIGEDLEAAALAIAEQMDRKAEDTKKLEQLRALLKGI